jgi:hypothetical protein
VSEEPKTDRPPAFWSLSPWLNGSQLFSFEVKVDSLISILIAFGPFAPFGYFVVNDSKGRETTALLPGHFRDFVFALLRRTAEFPCNIV